MCNPFLPRKIVFVLALLSMGISETTYAADQQWIDKVIADRETAYQLITTGALTDGAVALVTSLREIPTDQPELMDTAYGSVQLFLYTMEYLMDESTRTLFVSETMNPEQHPIDHFLIAAYNVYIGQDSEPKALATQDLLQAAATSNSIARIGSLFILSDPYFFDNADFTRQSQDILASEFPNLAITLEAHRYNVYGARKSSLEEQSKTASVISMKSTESQKFRTDPVIAATIQAVSDASAKSSADAFQIFDSTIKQNQDWRVRFGALLMLEPYAQRGQKEALIDTCEAIASAKSELVTPDVVRARLMLLKMNRDAWDTSTPGSEPPGVQWVNTLLDTRWTENPFERCLYEDVMKGLMNAAKHLVQIGKPEIAALIYDRLARQYPASLVSKQCEDELSQIRGTERSTK